MRVTAKICEISNLKACQKFLDFSDVVIHSVHIFHRNSIIKKEVSMVIWLMSGGRYESRCGDEIRVLKNQWKTTFHFNDRISWLQLFHIKEVRYPPLEKPWHGYDLRNTDLFVQNTAEINVTVLQDDQPF